MTALAEFMRWSVFGVLIIVVGYALARGASWAYFRSKYEHWRRLRRDIERMKKEEDC